MDCISGFTIYAMISHSQYLALSVDIVQNKNIVNVADIMYNISFVTIFALQINLPWLLPLCF